MNMIFHVVIFYLDFHVVITNLNDKRNEKRCESGRLMVATASFNCYVHNRSLLTLIKSRDL